MLKSFFNVGAGVGKAAGRGMPAAPLGAIPQGIFVVVSFALL